jgi:hypothetical protein
MFVALVVLLRQVTGLDLIAWRLLRSCRSAGD